MGLFNFWKKNQKEEPKSVAGTQKVISGIRALRQSQQAFQEGEEDKQTLIEQTGALIEEMNYSFGFNLKNSLPSGGIRSLDEGE